MRTALLILLAVAAPALASQTVWKWVDERGVTHYSDRPVPGATKIELSSGSNRWDSGASTPAPSAAAQPAQPDVAAYRNFEIWKPSQGESVINTGGQVTVNIRVEPRLQGGHSLNLYLDGKLIEGFAENTESYDLTEVPRGVHSLTATIDDRNGNRLQESSPVSFTVRQESAAQPPVGPALRPPPKPRQRGANKLPPSRQPSYAALNGAPPRINPATNKPVVPAPPKPKGPKQGN